MVDRLRLGNHPPFPRHFDDGPFCAAEQHIACKRIWSERWFFIIGRKIHDTVDPLPLLKVPDALEAIEHRGMNLGCKNYILAWLRGGCEQLRTEETIIRATVNQINVSL